MAGAAVAPPAPSSASGVKRTFISSDEVMEAHKDLELLVDKGADKEAKNKVSGERDE